MKRKLGMLIDGILGVVIILCILGIALYTYNTSKSETDYDKLRTQVTKEEKKSKTNNTTASSHENSSGKQKIMKKYSKLKKRNSDFIGWISNDDSIDYPVMYGDEYERKNFDKNLAIAGSIFINNSPDDKILMLYGHNMKNLTMFGSLRYYEQEAYFKNNRKLKYSDLYNDYTYKLLGVASCDYKEDNYNYYDYIHSQTKKGFKKFKNYLKSSLVRGSLSSLRYNDNIIILSTCDYRSNDSRRLVIFKRI